MALYNAAGGDHWTYNNNWASDVDLDEWYGVTTDPSGRIVLELVLEENGLFGTLPPELGDLANLQKLDLSGNQLQGEIPPEIANLPNLQDLDLGQNQLRGEIPWELGDFTSLEVLVLAANRLDGEIPPVLGDLIGLRTLDLSGNQLRGEIPPELGNLRALQRLLLQDNVLEGALPPELGGLVSLVELDISGNAVSGCLPEGSGLFFCSTPTAVQASIADGEISIQWRPVEGATYYNIYYHSANDNVPRCPGNCVLEGTVFEPPYVGPFKPGRGYHYGSERYWLVACTNDGCTFPLLVHGQGWQPPGN